MIAHGDPAMQDQLARYRSAQSSRAREATLDKPAR
jgi:hypothetical protein